MGERKISEIYDRHLRGDLNTTTDLLTAAQHFEELEWRAMVAGPVFQLAAIEAGRVARAMREFVSARCAATPLPTHPQQEKQS